MPTAVLRRTAGPIRLSRYGRKDLAAYGMVEPVVAAGAGPLPSLDTLRFCGFVVTALPFSSPDNAIRHPIRARMHATRCSIGTALRSQF